MRREGRRGDAQIIFRVKDTHHYTFVKTHGMYNIKSKL